MRYTLSLFWIKKWDSRNKKVSGIKKVNNSADSLKVWWKSRNGARRLEPRWWPVGFGPKFPVRSWCRGRETLRGQNWCPAGGSFRGVLAQAQWGGAEPPAWAPTQLELGSWLWGVSLRNLRRQCSLPGRASDEGPSSQCTRTHKCREYKNPGEKGRNAEKVDGHRNSHQPKIIVCAEDWKALAVNIKMKVIYQHPWDRIDPR